MSFERAEKLRDLAEIVGQRTSVLKSAMSAINEISSRLLVANTTSTNVAEVDNSIKVQTQTVAPEPKPITNMNVNFASGATISDNTANIVPSDTDGSEPTSVESEADRLTRLRSQAALHARSAVPIERGAGEIEGNGSLS